MSEVQTTKQNFGHLPVKKIKKINFGTEKIYFRTIVKHLPTLGGGGRKLYTPPAL